MKIRTRMAGAVAGTAFAGLAALAVGTAAPAGAQQVKPAQPAVSTATPQQATLSQGCGWRPADRVGPEASCWPSRFF